MWGPALDDDAQILREHCLTATIARLREPILKLMHVLRTLEYQPQVLSVSLCCALLMW